MYRELVGNIGQKETRIALLEEKKLAELIIERKTKKGIVGNIYKGRVESIVPGIQAAFVEIGLKKNGFLYVSDVLECPVAVDELVTEAKPRKQYRGRKSSIEDILKEGQEIMVQVAKEPIGEKGTRLTAFVSLAGRYLVMMPTANHLGISRKIENQNERERLKNIIEELRPSGVGFIVRTAAEGKGKKEFSSDIKYLMDLWEKISQRMRTASAPSLLHEELDPVQRIVRDVFTQDINRFTLDSEIEYSRVLNLLNSLAPGLKSRVKLYRGKAPIFEKHKLETEIDKALRRKIWLKSGGYIIIERTEAMAAIDVNTGKYTGKKKIEETVFKTNIEAAKEVARQLRLRDIGGIIVIDFIDMTSEKNKAEVVRVLQEALKRDRSKTNVSDITELGLVEMTRKRVRQNLTETLCEPCRNCGGSGWVKSITTTIMSLFHALEKACAFSSTQHIIVKAREDVIKRLQTSDADVISSIESRFGRNIRLQADGLPESEDFLILSAKTGKPIKSD